MYRNTGSHEASVWLNNLFDFHCCVIHSSERLSFFWKWKLLLLYSFNSAARTFPRFMAPAASCYMLDQTTRCGKQLTWHVISIKKMSAKNSSKADCTLPVVWIRGGHRGAFAGGAVITVVPLVGVHWVWEEKKKTTISLFFKTIENVTCVRMQQWINEMDGEKKPKHAHETTSKQLRMCHLFGRGVKVKRIFSLSQHHTKLHTSLFDRDSRGGKKPYCFLLTGVWLMVTSNKQEWGTMSGY